MRAVTDLVADLYGGDSMELASSLDMQGDLLVRAGQGSAACEVLLQAYRMHASADDRPAFFKGIAANHLARARLLCGQSDLAGMRAREALALYLDAFGEQRDAVARAHGSIAAVLAATDRHGEALAEALRMLSIDRNVHGEDSLRVARSRLTLAELALDMKDRERAQQELLAAEPVFQKYLADDHTDRALLRKLWHQARK